MPVETGKMSEEQIKEMQAEDPGIHKIGLAKISQSNLLHRKANVNDFKDSIDNPTVLPPYIELYAKFQSRYGHQDQNKCADTMLK